MLNDSALRSLWPLANLFQSFHDNAVGQTIEEPAIGGIVRCELPFALADHSGIYTGNGEIVHLDGDGIVQCSTAQDFLNRLNGWNTAISVYTDCQGMTPVGNLMAAQRALAQTGQRLPYHLLGFNCHRFTAQCLTGESHPDVFLFNDLKTFQRGNQWRVWRH